MRLLPLLLILLALAAPLAQAQEEAYIYTGIVYILSETPQGLALAAETPVTVTYFPMERLVDISHGISHPAVAAALKRVLSIPFTGAEPAGETIVDVVYMASSTRSLYLCKSGLEARIPGGRVILDPGSLVPLAAEYSVESQGLVFRVSIQLSVAPGPICGESITSPAKLALVGGISLAIIAGAIYAFTSWRSRLTPLWFEPGPYHEYS
ncbi:MAG: hypothetical protein GSR84_07110 [Desulfurococcales archaeon]|nr:hypothetical protein [Desulfurococcales archaeon]